MSYKISGWELFGVYFVDSLVDKLIYIAQRAADGMPMMQNVVAHGRQLTADVRARHTVQSLMAKAKEKVYAAAIESKGKLMEIQRRFSPFLLHVVPDELVPFQWLSVYYCLLEFLRCPYFRCFHILWVWFE